MLGFLSAATTGAAVKAKTTASATKQKINGFLVDALIVASFSYTQAIVVYFYARYNPAAENSFLSL
jgi:hypothetical protein